jgi:hypothetical protein
MKRHSNGLQTKRTPQDEAEYFGHLAKVALWFYIDTGNEAELRAAYYYTRYAVRATLVVLEPSCAPFADLPDSPKRNKALARWSLAK